MQQPSPALSSPSTGFLGPRVSPLFGSPVDQTSDGGVAISNSDLLRSSTAFSRPPQDQEQQAPPKKLSEAMEGLQRAHRHIADIRSGADLLLEALEIAVNRRVRETPGKKASVGVVAAVENMRKALDALRTTGRELDSSGILRGAQQRYDDNQPWGLQPPSVCPDGHVTPYAWKRQFAAQAAASAVERTRLALKSFGEQKKHLLLGVGDERRAKKLRAGAAHGSAEDGSLVDVLRRIQTDATGMVVTPYARLEWAKRTTCGNISKAGTDPAQSLAQLTSQSGSVKLEPGTSSVGFDGQSRPIERVAVLEVSLPGILRAVVSLQPTGSIYPDALAVFSPDESGGYVHAWGKSVHKLHQRISEHGVNALHHFRRNSRSTSLELLLHWIYTYRTLFLEPCKECKRLTALDAPSDLLLPPLVRLFHRLALPPVAKSGSIKVPTELAAYHVGCIPKKELDSAV
ncbi:hypothetical protein R1flu_016833 [Riccia fluitans]|uniref:Mediator of RNA polymerase II transcription subunit 27 n=1 Tax=Riccia fluitans TaxID=41844 RepID=A0ABD1YMZ2_9MARC